MGIFDQKVTAGMFHEYVSKFLLWGLEELGWVSIVQTSHLIK